MYEIFLCYIRDLFIEQNPNISSEEIYNSKIWEFLLSCFSQHKEGIEAIIRCSYIPDDCFLRETLSGDYQIIKLNEENLFLESILSGKSDIVPSVTFSLPNMIGLEHLSNCRFLRIEFSKEGLSGIY